MSNVLIELELASRITKAKALCGEVVFHYCDHDKIDLFSEQESDRLDAYELCNSYERWSILLHCALDMLNEAETLIQELTTTISNG